MSAAWEKKAAAYAGGGKVKHDGRTPLQKENEKVCAACNGRCCRKLPGAIFPQDLGKSKEEIRVKLNAMLETREYSVDWWEGDDPIYYIRPKTVLDVGLYNGSWGGECTFFTDGVGCSLTFKERPRECRYLIPYKDGCKIDSKKNGREGAAKAWAKYQDVILMCAGRKEEEEIV